MVNLHKLGFIIWKMTLYVSAFFFLLYHFTPTACTLGIRKRQSFHKGEWVHFYGRQLCHFHYFSLLSMGLLLKKIIYSFWSKLFSLREDPVLKGFVSFEKKMVEHKCFHLPLNTCKCLYHFRTWTSLMASRNWSDFSLERFYLGLYCTICIDLSLHCLLKRYKLYFGQIRYV